MEGDAVPFCHFDNIDIITFSITFQIKIVQDLLLLGHSYPVMNQGQPVNFVLPLSHYHSIHFLRFCIHSQFLCYIVWRCQSTQYSLLVSSLFIVHSLNYIIFIHLSNLEYQLPLWSHFSSLITSDGYRQMKGAINGCKETMIWYPFLLAIHLLPTQ